MLEVDDPANPLFHVNPNDFVIFLRQLRELLEYISNQPNLLSSVRGHELRQVVQEAVTSFSQSEKMLPNSEAQLREAGLMDAGGRTKLRGWWRAKELFYDWMSRKNARRALRWSGGILDSLSAICPPVKAVHEIVMAADNLIADADAASSS